MRHTGDVRDSDRLSGVRRRALTLVEDELTQLRQAGPQRLRELAGRPVDSEHEGIVVTTRVKAEGERLLVLVEAWRGRRTLATGGFAMAPDGTATTPH